MSTLEKTISYGEHDEDIILMHLFQSANRGFYIDIGAGWETAGSTTKALHQKGWNGINIEPNRSMIAEYQARRKGDINLQCIIADQNKLYDFFTFNDGSIQHASANYRYLISQKNSGFEITKIHGARLDYIWDNFVPEDQLVHFLKISANGFENEIITNTNWKKNRPWIVLVQTENLPGQKPND
ncbi:MAG: FkbM family methyltransferase, partial [Pseudomonadota bacterium]